MRLKGSYNEYLAHRLGWYRNPHGQRLGQYICNMMLAEGLSWPELFYTPVVQEVDRLVELEFGIK